MDRGISHAYLRLLVLAMSVVVAISAAGIAGAHSDEEPRELFHVIEGVFDITLEVEPVEILAGIVHFAVTVLVADDLTPVERAVVNVVAISPDGVAIQARAVTAPGPKGIYETNLALEPGGLWSVTVDVHKEGLGNAIHEVSLPVGDLQLSAVLLGTVLWFLTAMALLGGGYYLWRRSRSALSHR